MDTNVFLPGQLLIRELRYSHIAQDDSDTDVRPGTEFFQVLQKANAKRRLARHARAAQQTAKGMLEL